MGNQEQGYTSFEAIQARLDEITEAVSDDSLPLDDAISLFEEAASLGLRASDLLEDGIDPDQELAREQAEQSDGQAASSAESTRSDADSAARG